ncbi:M23 family metallopeptidase, partial [Serratia aquatilis]
KRDKPPLNYNGGTDFGYVLLKHETEIGSGEVGNVEYYSLYMHMGSIKSEVKQGARVYRKDPLGQVGKIDGRNGIHFQIFCDDANLQKLVGRTTPELDISKDGRSDIVYGDMHFYLPAGTPFYPTRPSNNGLTPRESARYKSSEPLYVTMHFEKGSCSMTTRQKAKAPQNGYTAVGEVLVNADGADYEYNLYKTALDLYPDSPSAGYELLRFGRVINTEHETLVPANAPLWRTVNYPGGKGWVNLAASEIKKFSDGDFPHWMGWLLVDDDVDNNSQCNSLSILCRTDDKLSRTICH